MIKEKNKKFSFIMIMFCVFVSLFFIINPVVISAQTFKDFFPYLKTAGEQATYNVQKQGSDSYVNNLLGNIIAIVIGLIGSLFLILILYSGWQWLTASGEEEKINTAKKHIKNGVIGLGLCLLAFVIASFVNNFLEQRFLANPVVNQGVQPPTGESIVCSTNAQCSDRPFTSKCLRPQGICVECVLDDDCSPMIGQVKGSCVTNHCVDTSGCSKKTTEACKADDDDQCNYVKDDNSCKPILNSHCGKCTAPKNICYNKECVQECTDVNQCDGGFGFQGWVGSCKDGICSW